MTTELITKVASFAAFGLPISIVVAARFVGAAATDARASVSIPPTSLPEIEPSVTQPFFFDAATVTSPFWGESESRVAEPNVVTIPTESQIVRDAPIQIKLTAVMPSARSPLAVINGKPCKIGDMVAPQWTLTAIDGDSRTVTISSASGQERVIKLSR